MNCSENLQLSSTKFACCKEAGHIDDHVDGEMRWFNAGHTGETPEQKHRRSLMYAVARAREVTSETGESCYIAESEIYANSYHEYDNIKHVVATKAAFASLMPNIGKDPWGHIVGVVDNKGEAFMNNTEDTLILLSEIMAKTGKKPKIDIHLVGDKV